MTSIQFFHKTELDLPIEFTDNQTGQDQSNSLSLTAVCFDHFIHDETEFYLIGYVQSIAKLFTKNENNELSLVLTIKFPIKYNSISCLKLLSKKRRKNRELNVLAGSATGHVSFLVLNYEIQKDKSKLWRYKILSSTSTDFSITKFLQQTDDEIQVLDTAGKVHAVYVDYLKNSIEINLIYYLRKSPALDIVKNSSLDTVILTTNNIQRIPDKTVLVNHSKLVDDFETVAICCLPNDELIFSKNNQVFKIHENVTSEKQKPTAVFNHDTNIFALKSVSNQAVLFFDELESIYLLDLLNNRILLKLIGVEFGYQPGIFKGIGLSSVPPIEIQKISDSCSCKNLIKLTPKIHENGQNLVINLFLKTHFIEVLIVKPAFSSEFSFQLLMDVNNGVVNHFGGSLLTEVFIALVLDQNRSLETYKSFVTDLNITTINFTDIYSINRILNTLPNFLSKIALDLDDFELDQILASHSEKIVEIISDKSCCMTPFPRITSLLLECGEQKVIRKMVLALPIHGYDVNSLIKNSEDHDLVSHIFVFCLGDELGLLEFLASRARFCKDALSSLVLVLTCAVTRTSFKPLGQSKMLDLTSESVIEFLCDKTSKFNRFLLGCDEIYDFFRVSDQILPDFSRGIITDMVKRANNFEEVFIIPQACHRFVASNAELFFQFEENFNLDCLKCLIHTETEVDTENLDRVLAPLLTKLSGNCLDYLLKNLAAGSKSRYFSARKLKKFSEIEDTLTVKLVHYYIHEVDVTPELVRKLRVNSEPEMFDWLVENNDLFREKMMNFEEGTMKHDKNVEKSTNDVKNEDFDYKSQMKQASDSDFDAYIDFLENPESSNSNFEKIKFNPENPKFGNILSLKGCETLAEIHEKGIVNNKSFNDVTVLSTMNEKAEKIVIQTLFKEKQLDQTIYGNLNNAITHETSLLIHEVYESQGLMRQNDPKYGFDRGDVQVDLDEKGLEIFLENRF